MRIGLTIELSPLALTPARARAGTARLSGAGATGVVNTVTSLEHH
jgi:hypothetical protein